MKRIRRIRNVRKIEVFQEKIRKTKVVRIMMSLDRLIYDLFQRRISETRAEQLKRLQVGKNREDSVRRYYRKVRNAFLTAGFVLLLLLLSVLLYGGDPNGLVGQNKLRRQEPGGTTEQIELEAVADGNRREITVEIAPRTYTAEEVQAQIETAKQYLQKNCLGANASSEHISHDLQLVTSIPGSTVEVEWQTDAGGLVETDGSIHWDLIDTAAPVEIQAVLSCQGEREEFPLAFTLYPPERSAEARFWTEWEKRQEELAEQTESEEYLALPETVEGHAVSYAKKQKGLWKYLLIGAIITAVMVPLCLDSQVRQNIRKREQELSYDYPGLLEQYVLLIGAGMTVKGAWMRIAQKYLEDREQGKQPYRFVYEEMLVTMREMESGMSETQAYELFGNRTGLLPYRKFSTLLVQNLRKGSEDLLNILEYEVADAFRERKERARTLGGEAGTKLLAPMMLMLGIVLTMILYAAFDSM